MKLKNLNVTKLKKSSFYILKVDKNIGLDEINQFVDEAEKQINAKIIPIYEGYDLIPVDKKKVEIIKKNRTKKRIILAYNSRTGYKTFHIYSYEEFSKMEEDKKQLELSGYTTYVYGIENE